MTQFKGTPAPWKWTSDLVNEGNALIGNNGNFVFYGDNICAGLSNDDGWGARIGGTHSDEESEANARLIAAAPELLEALQMAEKAMVKGRNVTYPEWYGVINKARAAIAKATGETK